MAQIHYAKNPFPYYGEKDQSNYCSEHLSGRGGLRDYDASNDRGDNPQTHATSARTPAPADLRSSLHGRSTINEGDNLELGSKDRIPYVLIENLGHGASAIVEMVRDINNNQTYARKVFRNYHTRNLEEVKRAFQNELRVMRRLKSHHHIIRVFATYITQRELALILTPVADSGDLAIFLQHYRDMDPSNRERGSKEATLWKAYGCLASGLAFIHQQTIRHKDIKPQNILIHQGNVLFADFGISFDFSEHGQSTTTGRPNSFTKRYCAPEVADFDKRNSKSDVFSLGCVYAEILDTVHPNLVPDSFLKGPFHQTLDQLSPMELLLDIPKKKACHHMLKLIQGMLAFNVEERMSAQDVVAFLPVYLDEMDLFCKLCIPDRDIGKKSREDFDGGINMDDAYLSLDGFDDPTQQEYLVDKSYIMRRFLGSNSTRSSIHDFS